MNECCNAATTSRALCPCSKRLLVGERALAADQLRLPHHSPTICVLNRLSRQAFHKGRNRIVSPFSMAAAACCRRPVLRALRPWCRSAASFASSATRCVPNLPHLSRPGQLLGPWRSFQQRLFHNGDEIAGCGDGGMTVQEAKRLLRQVNIEALKKQLQVRECPCIDYDEMVRLCREVGLVESPSDARKLVLAMDEAGEIVLFRNKVFLDPQQIAELIANALPVHLVSEDDPRVKEFEELQRRKEVIDEVADKQVRKFLWFGLLTLTAGTGLFVRLTFWELSWDVMEPIAFFMTTSFLIAGYAYFLFSRRDPTYQGLMHSLLASRRKRLMKATRFDCNRYKELEKQCITTCRQQHNRGSDEED